MPAASDTCDMVTSADHVVAALQAARLTDQEVLEYLQHLQGGILSGNKPPDPLAAVQELLTIKADAWKSAVPRLNTQDKEQPVDAQLHADHGAHHS